MTDPTHSPAEIIADEIDEWGLSPWFEQTDFEVIDLARQIVRALTEAGAIADLSTHVIVPKELTEERLQSMMDEMRRLTTLANDFDLRAFALAAWAGLNPKEAGS